MTRPELHSPRPVAAVAARPARPHFDAIALKAAQEEDARTTEAVAALLRKVEEAVMTRAADSKAGKVA